MPLVRDERRRGHHRALARTRERDLLDARDGRAGRGVRTTTRSARKIASSTSCVTSSSVRRFSRQALQQPVLHRGAGEGIERAERLVQQHQRPPGKQRAQKCDPLAHPARRAGRDSGLESVEPELGEAGAGALRALPVSARPSTSSASAALATTVRQGKSKSRCRMYAVRPSRSDAAQAFAVQPAPRPGPARSARQRCRAVCSCRNRTARSPRRTRPARPISENPQAPGKRRRGQRRSPPGCAPRGSGPGTGVRFVCWLRCQIVTPVGAAAPPLGPTSC